MFARKYSILRSCIRKWRKDEKNISEVSTSGNVQFLQSKISELTLELDLLKKRLSDTDGGKEREENGKQPPARCVREHGLPREPPR